VRDFLEKFTQAKVTDAFEYFLTLLKMPVTLSEIQALEFEKHRITEYQQ
jgi:hypothetical protein